MFALLAVVVVILLLGGLALWRGLLALRTTLRRRGPALQSRHLGMP